MSRARACRYVVVRNALGKGSDIISSLSSAGMFPYTIYSVKQKILLCRCTVFNDGLDENPKPQKTIVYSDAVG